MEKYEFTECSDEEYLKYQEAVSNGDEKVLAQVQKFFHGKNSGVTTAFAMGIKEDLKIIYPIIMSNLSDDKKLEILNLIFPHTHVV